MLQGKWGTTDDAEKSVNCSFGPHYTGRSGNRGQPRWVRESIDLTHLAGQKILLRFEYVTDQSSHKRGLALDDLAIQEIGYTDDGEMPDGWQAQGFIHLRNDLLVRFFLRAIEFRADGPVIHILDVEPSGQATFSLPGQGTPNRRIVLLISAVAPYLEQPILYRYRIE